MIHDGDCVIECIFSVVLCCFVFLSEGLILKMQLYLCTCAVCIYKLLYVYMVHVMFVHACVLRNKRFV